MILVHLFFYALTTMLGEKSSLANYWRMDLKDVHGDCYDNQIQIAPTILVPLSLNQLRNEIEF